MTEVLTTGFVIPPFPAFIISWVRERDREKGGGERGGGRGGGGGQICSHL
jgi:hypothetical protein